MSIEIKAKTRDPEMSAEIVNFVINHIDGIREKIFKANTYQTLIHFENTFFDKNDYVNKLVDSIYNLREQNTSESLNLLYDQIKQKQKDVNDWRVELNSIRNQYKFYLLESSIESINTNLNQARSIYTMEKGKYEVYIKSYTETDTLIINTRARIEGASGNIKEFETEIARFDTIKKKYEELTEKIQSGLEQLRKLNEQYENTLSAFEPFTNSIRLERLSNDYAHQQVILNELRYQYENTLQKYLNPIPSVYVIDRAEPSFDRVFPKLWKIGLIIILSTMTLTVGLLLLGEKYKSIRSVLDESSD
jgi:chromosome segregation ATPase